MQLPFLSFESTNKEIKKEILQSFESFFDREWYVLGEDTTHFEKQYAEFNKVKNVIGVSNGLDALHLALKLLNIGPGHEVIVPSNTFIATVLAISYVGATPVFVEPRITTYNLDPNKIEQAITSKTRAIMPVHLYGQACEMEQIMHIAEKYNLFVVEDNAQAQGACYKGKLTGSWGNVNGTSFYPGKNLGAYGDAGAITTNDAEIAKKAAILRNYGSGRKYHNDVIGYNMRLDECQAGFLNVKLKFLPKWTKQRQEIASWYNEALKNIGDLILPIIAEEASHVYHLYVIRTEKRNELQQYLNERGIGTLIHYPVPPHLQEAYINLAFKKGDFPIAEEIANTCLSLPIWPGLKKNDIDRIAAIIKLFYNE
ncbi:aminotransferase [Adhaeribacter aerolatus]|uniref:Aminotransferase n=1 Tax=Adhaeribacter aerolatus TaxID=670289 RepID=A0A512AU34_9BACT|nr:DegT/DnrJ/EryC1/StrS family aminotransferase [Adhaeribacter aerolatus]GEO03226.1 aminotransferase [Adhaeribacter aerolatus]